MKEGNKMSEQLTFQETYKKYASTLTKYVPIVDRVHGPHHPEFHDVVTVFDTIKSKVTSSKGKVVILDNEFAQLKSITNDYEVPEDVCETYAAVYQMLEIINQSYDQQAGGFQ